jgi:hypothetical protein
MLPFQNDALGRIGREQRPGKMRLVIWGARLLRISANTLLGSPFNASTVRSRARQSVADASNSLIQSLIAAFALSIFSCVGRLCSTLESAIPTLPRASLRLPPLDKFRTAAPLAFMSFAKTSDLRIVVNFVAVVAGLAYVVGEFSVR